MGLAGDKDARVPAVGRLGDPQTLLTATAIYRSLSPLKRPGGARRTQQGTDVLSEETAGHGRGTQTARLGVSLPWEERPASRLRHSPG